MSFELNAKNGIKIALSVIAFVFIIYFLNSGIVNAGEGMDKKMAEAIKNSVVEGATLCYSVEGAYPKSVDYLVENYGIKYDKSRYIVHYRYIAANISPEVVIVEI